MDCWASICPKSHDSFITSLPIISTSLHFLHTSEIPLYNPRRSLPDMTFVSCRSRVKFFVVILADTIFHAINPIGGEVFINSIPQASFVKSSSHLFATAAPLLPAEIELVLSSSGLNLTDYYPLRRPLARRHPRPHRSSHYSASSSLHLRKKRGSGVPVGNSTAGYQQVDC